MLPIFFMYALSLKPFDFSKAATYRQEQKG